MTLERGAILHAQVIRLSNGEATVDLPVGPSPTSGLAAAVTLVRGRTAPCCAGGAADPGRPTSVSQTVDVPVDRGASTLAVTLEVPEGYQPPGTKARVRVRVRDAAGRPAPARVTVWAVDEGVLALSRYTIADVSAIYDVEAPALNTADTRQYLLGRTVPAMPWGMLNYSE